MQDREQLVAAIIASAPEQKLVSRVRFQKIAYLLEQLGCNLGFEFSYHHYGPFSHDLERAILDAKAFGLIEEELAHRQSDGASYSIFKLSNSNVDTNAPDVQQFKSQIKRFAHFNVTILELAATAHWLASAEKISNWKDEIIKRKGIKTQAGRLEKALDLLKELNLPPGACLQ